MPYDENVVKRELLKILNNYFIYIFMDAPLVSWNLPNPDIMTSSPDSSDCLMISNRISVTSAAYFRE